MTKHLLPSGANPGVPFHARSSEPGKQTKVRASELTATANSGRAIPANLRTRFGKAETHAFAGYVVDPAELTKRFVVQLLVDGTPMQIAIADQFDASLAREGIGDGCYGFVFAMPADSLADATVVEARLANSDMQVGGSIDVRREAIQTHAPPGLRGVRWIGGLRFCGWLEASGPDLPKVVAMIDGQHVSETYARTWHQVGGRGEIIKAVPAFDLHLPTRFADGRVRSVQIIDEAGQDLPGSPLTFVAFEDGLERTLATLGQIDSERLRGELFDRLIPASLPISRYAEWAERFPAPDVQQYPDQASVSVIFVGAGDEARSVDSLREQSCSNWIAAVLSQDADATAFDCSQLDEFFVQDGSASDVFVFAPCGTKLERRAVDALAAAFAANPDATVVYADYSILGNSGESWPVFLPAFDYERMLEQGCGACLFATRRQHLDRALAARPDNLFRLFQELAGESAEQRNRVVHLPGCLGSLPTFEGVAGSRALASATAVHLGKKGIKADVSLRPNTLFPAVRVQRRPDQQSVSIIIPTRNQADLLRRCIDTIAPAATRLGAQILVVDNDSSDAETLDYLAAIAEAGATVMRAPGVFNFSRLNNLAARVASGDLLCLLNNDIEALDDLWLGEMMARMAESDVGAVGATLLWPSGVIQHAGVVLGPNLGASHAFTDRMHGDAGYGGMLSVARECSAVTAACLLTRKTDYFAVGGLDEISFPVNFNDVDYCLKLRALGRRVVMTPDARLLHIESASRGTDERPDRSGRLHRELRMLRARWLETIVNDPYYSPLLSLDSIPFSALAWPPRDREPRINRAPRAVEIPLGM